jgi:hypothetical protein
MPRYRGPYPGDRHGVKSRAGFGVGVAAEARKLHASQKTRTDMVA